jgi:hypothetical protein
MRDFLEIGSTPAEEECVQVGEDNYRERATKEMRRFIERIREVLGPEPEGAQLSIKWFPHDFGTYGEVVCYFDEGNDKAREYAFKCDSDAPSTWK